MDRIFYPFFYGKIMADQQLEDLGTLTSATIAADDAFLVNDDSDTTNDAGGEPKTITYANLHAAVRGTATLFKDFVFQPTAMSPLETNAPAWETVDFGTIVATVASFDDTLEEYLNGKFIVPAEIAGGSSSVQFEVTISPKTGAASKVTAWTFGHRPVATAEAIDGSYTDEDSGDKSITATTGYQTIATWTETITNLGWTAGDTVYFRLSRDPAPGGGGTDLTGDCYLLLFRIKIPVVI